MFNFINLKIKLAKFILLDWIVFLSCIYLSYRFNILLTEDAWLNRSDFFGNGIYSPTIFDFLINEVVLSLILIAILVGQFRWWYIFFFLLCSIVYFTRASITLSLIAILLSPTLSRHSKIILLLLGATSSFLILVVRHGGDIPSIDDINLYFFTYVFVGVGRLLTTTVNFNMNEISSFTLFFRPIGIFSFIIDYLYQLDGALSVERYAGGLLSEFAYIPLLNDYYNAFGTILFPYVLSFGAIFGFLIFLISIFFEYFSMRFFFKRSHSLRIISFILLSGFLFSWNAPFIWCAPFFYSFLSNTKLHNTLTGNIKN